jgi:hypothetical protein
MSAEAVWNSEPDDFMYPAPPAEVLPRLSADETRSLLVERETYGRAHPEELMSVQEIFESVTARR